MEEKFQGASTDRDLVYPSDYLSASEQPIAVVVKDIEPTETYVNSITI